MEMTAPAASIVPGQVEPVTFSRIAARPASWSSNWTYGCAATATSETKMYRVVTMARAIMIAGGSGDPAEPEGDEVGEIVGVPPRDANKDKEHQHANLDQHHDGVDLC